MAMNNAFMWSKQMEEKILSGNMPLSIVWDKNWPRSIYDKTFHRLPGFWFPNAFLSVWFSFFLLLHLTGQLVLCLCSSLFYSEIIRCYKSMCSQCLRSNHVAKQKSITAVGSTYSSSPFQKNRKWKHYLQQLISPTTW